MSSRGMPIVTAVPTASSERLEFTRTSIPEVLRCSAGGQALFYIDSEGLTELRSHIDMLINEAKQPPADMMDGGE